MARKLKSFGEALQTDWPCQEDFQEGLVFEHEGKLNEIFGALEDNKRVVFVAGPPRSGKSTLARLASWKLEKGSFPEPVRKLGRKEVWYLDISEVEDGDLEDSTRFTDDSGRFYIIENWHVVLKYQRHVAEVINRCSKAQFLVTCTTFSENEKQEVAEDFADVCIVSVFPQLFAEGIINHYIMGHIGDKLRQGEFLAWLKEAPSEHKPASAEDYEAALMPGRGEKKLRGNLRLLTRRLEVWDPRICPLQEVGLMNVFAKLRRDLREIEKGWPLLKKVSAICQWEMPFLCKGSYPSEADDLVERNFLVPKLGGWHMDSTDAYLFLRCEHPLAQWKQVTTEALAEYVHDQKQLSWAIVSRLVTNVEGSEIFLRLLEDKDILQSVQQALKTSAEDETLSFYGLHKVAASLLGNLPEKQEEAEQRLDIAAALFSIDIASVAGRSARGKSLQTVNWFLGFLRKGEARLVEFVRFFLEGYGIDSLVTSVRTSRSWKVQRKLRSHLNYFAPSLYKELLPLIRSPVPQSVREIPFRILLSRLTVGSIESAQLRRNKITSLASIDENYLLDNLKGNPLACSRLQFLVQSALWLSKSQAWRLAGIVPSILPKLGLVTDNGERCLIEDEANKLSYLVTNCWFANQSAAQELVNLLLEVPLRTIVPPQRASGIGKFLSQIERVQHGAVGRWCSTETGYLSNLFLQLEEDTLDDLIFSLAVFAPDVLTHILVEGDGKTRQKIQDTSVSHRVWSRCGALSLGGEPWQMQTAPNIPEAHQIAECEPVGILLALHGLQLNVGLEGIHTLFSQLQTFRQTSPWVPLLLARNPMPWTQNQTADVVRAVMQGGLDPIDSALRNIILACMVMHSIEWECGHKFDTLHDGHRALQTAIYEWMLKLEFSGDGRGVRANINEQHDIARHICWLFRRLLAPVLVSPLSIEEWDAALSDVGTGDRIDSYRSMLLRARVVEWSVTAQGDRLEPRFFASGEIQDKFLYELIGLPKGRSVAEKHISVNAVPVESLDGLDFEPLVKRMTHLEETNTFVSFDQLQSDLTEQGIANYIQAALETGILLTYYVENYRNPQSPMQACRLNRGHSVVLGILAKSREKAE